MKKIMMAVLAGMLSVAFASAYAGEAKGEAKKSDTGMTKSEKGMEKKEAMPDDTKKKGKGKKDEMTK